MVCWALNLIFGETKNIILSVLDCAVNYQHTYKMSNTISKQPVCMVIGAGAGIGGNVAKRFAKEGFHSVLCRRSNQHGLDDLIRGIEERGGTASGYLINVV